MTNTMSAVLVDIHVGDARVGRMVLEDDGTGRSVSFGGRGHIVAAGEGILPVHAWFSLRRGSLFAMSADADSPARWLDVAIPTQWSELVVPCTLAIGEARVTFRRLEARRGADAEAEPAVDTPPIETRVDTPPVDAREPSSATRLQPLQVSACPERKPPPQPSARATAPRLSSSDDTPSGQMLPNLDVGTRGMGDPAPRDRGNVRVVVLGVVCMLLTGGSCALAGRGRYSLLPRSRALGTLPAPPHDSGTAAPLAPPPPSTAPRATTASVPPLAPGFVLPPATEVVDRDGERRIAEAMFAGDFTRALSECEALETSNPLSPDYPIIARVLRAKVQRSPSR